ncbi:carcinoembryonic antigen-related cell adhesion molecule 1-like [Stegostoma tigrinum]|uniref:carcinoembryonic antigen-related cell adhesion molecule 1-like n=1 Tax=Stegostoma tigrinum TaxID=3053191 RepID=UPI0028703228|nr:carcinoembryonic antigen-related cell adhesion molecule 1-like [Stegostoma tigrinum]
MKMKLFLGIFIISTYISRVEPQSFTIQAEHSRINASVGETAYFSVKPSRPMKNGNWDFKGKSIGLWIGSSVSISNDYKSRAEIFLPNGSLLLKSLTSSDSGKYTVTMVPAVGGPASATLTLHVIGKPQELLIQPEHSWINVNVGETALFSVSPSLTVKSGNWAFDGKSIGLWIGSSVSLRKQYESRADILLPNGSLVLKSLMSSDSGQYTVNMVSDVGGPASATLTLHVCVPLIQTEHRWINTSIGETALFSVKPSAAVKNGHWNFNGTIIALWINSSFFLSNEYKSRAEILLPNGSLLLKSVTILDSGEYTVTMVPEVGDQASATLTLHVLVEPQTFTIQAENRINVSVGGTANFSVKPSRSVKNGNWDFNGKSIGLWIGSSASVSNEYKSRAEILTPNGSLLLKSLTFSDCGKYTVTMVPEEGEQASATVTLHVLDQLNSRDNISDGAIAGIVIAVLLCLGFIIAITAWLIKRKSEGTLAKLYALLPQGHRFALSLGRLSV